MAIDPAPPHSTGPVAVLYQALPPPPIDGVRKPMKDSGYADSGADIAFALRRAAVPVVTPVACPRETADRDWVFPDDENGIAAALTCGAEVLWANTVLFAGHPVGAAASRCLVVGQQPEAVQLYDDKFEANARARRAGCPVAANALVAEWVGGAALPLEEISESVLAARGLRFPLVAKPVRGRGSQGVIRVADLGELRAAVRGLLASRTQIDGAAFPTYGRQVMVEEYLEGEELTVAVMPPGRYRRGGDEISRTAHWTLPPVARAGHREGIAPYSGVVAIVENSRAMGEAEAADPAVQAVLSACAAAGAALGAVAPLRIDCRRGRDGGYRIFDINLKPNMTGAGRQGREKQDSLVCLAARAFGWTYADLLLNMLRQAWKRPPPQVL